MSLTEVLTAIAWGVAVAVAAVGVALALTVLTYRIDGIDLVKALRRKGTEGGSRGGPPSLFGGRRKGDRPTRGVRRPQGRRSTHAQRGSSEGSAAGG